jgi:hypothetical protein
VGALRIGARSRRVPPTRACLRLGQAVRRISPVTLGILGLLVALVAANLVLSHAIPTGTGLKGIAIITLPFFAVGLLVARRQPGNSIGWLMLAFAFVVLLSIDAANYAVLVFRVHHELPLGRLAVFLAPAWVPVIVMAPLPIVLFPDGKIPRGRWRWTFWAYVALAVAFLSAIAAQNFGAFTQQRVVIEKSGSLSALTAPVHGIAAILNTAAIVLYVASFASMVAYQIVRFRHSTGDERQQLKWFLAGGALAVTGLIAATQSDTLGFMFVFVVALPLGIGFGILKYRLYDIDRLISRTVSYALLTGLLVGVFVGLVLLTTRVLPFSSPVGVAAATLAAAALFSPLRGRLQRLVDRRFNRARYDAEAVVAAFGARLRDAIDVEAVLAELSSVATRSLEPATVTVWVRNDSGTAPL